MLNWGILGTGMIAGKVLPCIRAAHRCAVTAVGSRDALRAQAFAVEHDLPESTGCDAEALLTRDDIHAVYVTSPNSLHVPWCLRLLGAGKHVLCEKPLTPRAQEAEQIAAAAKRWGKVFAEGLMYLHHPQSELLVRAGAMTSDPTPDNLIGPLHTIVASFCIDLRPRANAWTRFSHRLEGGAMMDLGCYPLSLARAVTGLEPAEITAISRAGTPIEGESRPVDSLTGFTARFPNGVILHALCAIDANAGIFAELVGDWGILRTETPFRADPVHAVVRLTRFENHPRGPGVEHITIANGGDRFTNQFTAFAAATRGERAMTPTPEWSIGQARAIERVYELNGLGW